MPSLGAFIARLLRLFVLEVSLSAGFARLLLFLIRKVALRAFFARRFLPLILPISLFAHWTRPGARFPFGAIRAGCLGSVDFAAAPRLAGVVQVRGAVLPRWVRAISTRRVRRIPGAWARATVALAALATRLAVTFACLVLVDDSCPIDHFPASPAHGLPRAVLMPSLGAFFARVYVVIVRVLEFTSTAGGAHGVSCGGARILLPVPLGAGTARFAACLARLVLILVGGARCTRARARLALRTRIAARFFAVDCAAGAWFAFGISVRPAILPGVVVTRIAHDVRRGSACRSSFLAAAAGFALCAASGLVA